MVAWNGGRARLVNVPRLVTTRFPRGTVFGRPNDREQQRRVLTAALDLLELDAPLEPVNLRETIDRVV
ncbi:MAG: hypothetical protein WAM60_15475 [Candidatus Promineifilaceae bacterium]